jgi:cytidine deaminase
MNQDQKANLIKAAKETLENPYPKDAQTVYSASVLTKNGNIYSAAQYFSDTYSLTLHAEQAVLSHAAAHGEGEIVAIAITSNEKLEKQEFTYPCHMCKQLLYESSRRSKINMEILIFNSFGEEQVVDINSMINYPWPK